MSEASGVTEALFRCRAAKHLADLHHQRQLDALHAELDALKLELAAGDYAALKAEADCLRDYLRRVLQIVDEQGGHSWPEQQATLRGARSVLR